MKIGGLDFPSSAYSLHNVIDLARDADSNAKPVTVYNQSELSIVHRDAGTMFTHLAVQ